MRVIGRRDDESARSMFENIVLSELPDEDDALRAGVRAVIATVTDTLALSERARTWMGFDAEFSRALGRAGLLGLTLPRRYGGADRGPFARFVIVEELLSAGAPVAAHWIAELRHGNTAGILPAQDRTR